jgi:hypothetical protein
MIHKKNEYQETFDKAKSFSGFDKLVIFIDI